MKKQISHVVVVEGGVIACQAILSDGSSNPTDLSVGRYGFEGYLEHENRRFLRLRDPDGWLKIVDERELLRQRKRKGVRICYRLALRPAPGPAQLACADGAPAACVSPITAADRAEVRMRLRESVPESLPREHLGTYEEYGSVDSWMVDYSIERRNGEWTIRCEDPGGERDASGFADIAALVEDACNRGYASGDLIGDLRRSRRPYLVALAHAAEEIAASAGWLDQAGSATASSPPESALARPDARTYVDDGGTRFYRHQPAPVRAFEAVLNIADRASNLSVGTPDGVHEIAVEIRAHRQGAMQPVLRVRGQATVDGGLELIVTNLVSQTTEVIHV